MVRAARLRAGVGRDDCCSVHEANGLPKLTSSHCQGTVQATQADSSTSGSGILRSSQPSSPQASASSCAGERASGAASRIPAFDSAAVRGPGRPLPRQRFISLTFEKRVELCMQSLQRTGGAPPALQGGAAVDSFALSMP